MNSKSSTVEVNKKARRDYEITEVFEAGIVLFGGELKSIRGGGLSLKESYVQVKNNECYLMDAHIAPYKFSRDDQLIGKGSSEPNRDRKLLLHKRDIIKLGAKLQTKGLTLVPLSAYFKENGRLKIEIGVGKGRKNFDKREADKDKQVKKTLDRALKQRSK